MKWAHSLVRLASHEVEALQRRLGEVVARRRAIEDQIATLDAEVRQEVESIAQYEEAGLYLAGFREGARIRRGDLEGRLAVIESEEAGARDALAEAFEAQKKYEEVAANADAAARKEQDRRDTAEMDELGLRRSVR